ncbi:hypothetical protein DSO57_1024642, partial [Entomophthora muscae]
PEMALLCPHASFYLPAYLVGYYLSVRSSYLLERFSFLGQPGHLAMAMLPIESMLFPTKQIPDSQPPPSCLLAPASQLPPAHLYLWPVSLRFLRKLPNLETKKGNFPKS